MLNPAVIHPTMHDDQAETFGLLASRLFDKTISQEATTWSGRFFDIACDVMTKANNASLALAFHASHTYSER